MSRSNVIKSFCRSGRQAPRRRSRNLVDAQEVVESPRRSCDPASRFRGKTRRTTSGSSSRSKLGIRQLVARQLKDAAAGVGQMAQDVYTSLPVRAKSIQIAPGGDDPAHGDACHAHRSRFGQNCLTPFNQAPCLSIMTGPAPLDRQMYINACKQVRCPSMSATSIRSR